MDLLNKKILFIAPSFYGYETEIRKELEKAGAEVYYVQDNIEDTSFLFRTLGKFRCAFFKKLRDERIKRSINKASKGRAFDYVFGIRLDTLNEDLINDLRKNNPNALFLCYFWDSVKNMRSAERIAEKFDRVYTFDSSDAKVHPSWILRPLFFCNDFKVTERSTGTIQFDILFIASLSKHRAILYSELQSFCTRYNYVLKTIFVSKWYIFLIHWFKYPEYRKIPYSIISHQGLTRKEIAEYYSKSKVVFDSSSPNQNGLTMRTLECFGAHKRMITTNNSIKEYDIYSPNNIYIYSCDKNEAMNIFMECDNWEEASPTTYQYYSLSGWLNSIFNGK